MKHGHGALTYSKNMQQGYAAFISSRSSMDMQDGDMDTKHGHEVWI
jgi:hypothetical protein